ncbi:MerR family transcriptional regulator [Bosea sp. ZW T0_25]|uniref:MerR family transcriptional regulator n=2 Tax=Bosea rubneri TaxID=3075434 RepID=A0ABU3S687_9HYPH|nr:MerR family transcriptional regulator [Bosea sp. ZW T0_25]MDU0340289.1 MerR family transcriptional regulator [Bosea sp. ZW T0_25]
MEPVRFRITEAARMAGVSASTLRLWEAQGLIEPIRTASGQRLYSREQLDRLQEIAWLRREKGLNPPAIADRMGREDASEAPAGAAADVSAREVPVGLKMRRLRQAAHETLEDVAQATAIPVSVLSTFERTSVGLSFKALHELARHFGTTVAAISGQEDHDGRESLVRAGAWATWPPTSPGVTVQALARGQTLMECHRFQLAPGASSEGTYEHEGEEFLHILSGSLEIVLDGDKFFLLEAGDSFYFESRRPHAWRNASEQETVVVWINTPSSF